MVDEAIRQVCAFRRYALLVIHVRTNHVHAAVSAACKTEPVLDAFKAYATKALRDAGLLGPDVKMWSRHRSTRYLWKERHVESAVDYVVNGQGDALLSLWDEG